MPTFEPEDLAPFLAWPGFPVDAEKLTGMLGELVRTAALSPCCKSKRGALFINSDGIDSYAYNAPAGDRPCLGNEACRQACARICNHAEERVILRGGRFAEQPEGKHLVHLKVVDGRPVPSGPPSCETCSRLALEEGVAAVWLWHAVVDPDDDRSGLRGKVCDAAGAAVLAHKRIWRAYTAEEFQEATLRTLGLPDPFADFPAFRRRMRLHEREYRGTFGIKYDVKIEGVIVQSGRTRQGLLDEACRRLHEAGVTPDMPVWDIRDRLNPRGKPPQRMEGDGV